MRFHGIGARPWTMTLGKARRVFFRNPPRRLQFGKRRHIAARNILRLVAEIDDLQALLIGEGLHRKLPSCGYIHSDATEEELIDQIDTLIELATRIGLTVGAESTL